jgi:hypothetical protein
LTIRDRAKAISLTRREEVKEDSRISERSTMNQEKVKVNILITLVLKEPTLELLIVWLHLMISERGI